MVMSFNLQKSFSFMRFHLLILDLSAWAIGVLFRKLSPVPMSSRLLPTFCSIRFSVSGFTLRSLIHLDLNFVQGDRYGSICILLHADIQLDQHHLLKMFSLFHCMSWFLCQIQVCVCLFLGLCFDSIDQPVCFYTKTMQVFVCLLVLTIAL